jgi:hypothetical protein
VVDPVRFVVEFVGQTGAADPQRAMQWVCDQLMMGVRTTLTRLLKSGDMTLMDLGGAGPDVARAIVQSCPDLANVGVQVLEIAKLNLNLSDEDQARIDEFQDQIVQAKIDARRAKIGVSRAEAEAQARQYQLDQDFVNRQRYVNQVDMGRYQQYAGAEAMLGMGQGMAQGGDASAGLAGAGVAAGMAMGAGMAYGARPPGYPPPGYGYPPGPQAYGPPGYGPGPYPPQAYPPGYGAPPGYPGAPPPNAQHPAATAGQPAAMPQGLRCAKCGQNNASGSKFCAECGAQLL